MLSIDEIMDDFRRNGKECDFAPHQDPRGRICSYNPAFLSWNDWPPEYYKTSHEKGIPFSATSADSKLARAISSLSLSGPPASNYHPQPESQQRNQSCQHRGTNSDHCNNWLGASSDPMFSAERADVLNFLQGNSMMHNELVRLIHEKAQALSQEHRLAQSRQDEANYLNSYDFLIWNDQANDPVLNVPAQAPRKVSTSRARTRTNHWERYESGGTSGRSSPIPRDIRFEMRPSQTSSRIVSSRHGFNRALNLKTQRNIEMDKTSDTTSYTLYSPSTPSVASSTASTPEPISTSDETATKDSPIKIGAKASLNGSAGGRKAAISLSSTTTPSVKSSGDGSCPSSPETPARPMSPRDPITQGPPKEAGGRTRGSQNRRRRYSSESQQTGGCAFCKKNGETPSVYKNHVAKDADGQTACDILQKYVCPLCGATGKKAHTVKYCPSNLNPHSSPSERFRSSRGGTHPNRLQKKSANGTN